MKALYFNGTSLELQERATPKFVEGESLVKVIMAGICRTDLEIFKGYMNFVGIPGHEFVGQVVESSDHSLLGKRVVAEINVGCGQCEFCKSGLDRHCADRSVLGIAGMNGAFADYVVVPKSNLCLVPDSVPDEKAVFTEPLAAALEILEQVHIIPASEIAIIGDGRLAYLIFLVLRLNGASIKVISKHPIKRRLFEESGARALSISDILNEKAKFDFVIEASGSPSGWGLATALVKPRGAIILKSTYHGALEFNAAELVINEIMVVGSRCGRFMPALRLLASGFVNPSALISEYFNLTDYRAAFKNASARDAFKTLFRM